MCGPQQYIKYTKYSKISKFTKNPKNTRYELCNLYIIQNKNLNVLEVFDFSSFSKIHNVFRYFWCYCKTNIGSDKTWFYCAKHRDQRKSIGLTVEKNENQQQQTSLFVCWQNKGTNEKSMLYKYKHRNKRKSIGFY